MEHYLENETPPESSLHGQILEEDNPFINK